MQGHAKSMCGYPLAHIFKSQTFPWGKTSFIGVVQAGRWLGWENFERVNLEVRLTDSKCLLGRREIKKKKTLSSALSEDQKPSGCGHIRAPVLTVGVEGSSSPCWSDWPLSPEFLRLREWQTRVGFSPHGPTRHIWKSLLDFSRTPMLVTHSQRFRVSWSGVEHRYLNLFLKFPCVYNNIKDHCKALGLRHWKNGLPEFCILVLVYHVTAEAWIYSVISTNIYSEKTMLQMLFWTLGTC